MRKSLKMVDLMALAGLCLVTAVALFGAWRVASKPPEPADAKELARIVREVASIARNTATTAQALQAGKTTGNYVRTHQEKLARNLDEQIDKLETPFEAPLLAPAEEARELSSELAQLLKDWKRHLGEPAAQDRLSAEAKRIAEAIARLEPAS